MSNVLMLVICLAAGMLLRRAGRVGDNAHQALNAVIVHLALPAGRRCTRCAASNSAACS